MRLLPKDGEVLFYPNFFSAEESDYYFCQLLTEVKWRQEPIKIFGKTIMQPRLTAWYSDPGVKYGYSGLSLHSEAWSETLLEIKRRIEAVSQVKFNGALLNQYRDEKDSMGWHRDDEQELGVNPVIGSVSFGATRTFQFRHIKDKTLKVSVGLSHGSFLLMRGSTQHFWEHSIAKKTKPIETRINLTFRVIK